MVSVATLAQVARKRFAGSAPLRTKQSIHYYCSRGYIYLLDIPITSWVLPIDIPTLVAERLTRSVCQTFLKLLQYIGGTTIPYRLPVQLSWAQKFPTDFL